MPTNDTVLVCVDDSDPAIQWDESWFSTQGNTDEWGDQGPPFLSTLHAITRNGSFTYSFRGRVVYVLGALRPRNISEGSGHDPDWECYLDGVQMDRRFAYPTVPSSNFPLCSSGESAAEDRDHTIEVRAVVRNETLYVDQVQYQALVDDDTSGTSTDWVEVRHEDGRFGFSRDDWREREGGYGTETSVNGAWFTYEFYGQGAIFGGYTPAVNTSAFVNGSATFKLDDTPPVVFNIPATASNKSYQPYFSLTDLQPGLHRLEVVNQGNASTPPLAFSYIYTQNAPQPPAKASRGGRTVGGAVGGGLGAAVLAALLIFLLVKLRRRRRRRRRREQINLEPEDDLGAAEFKDHHTEHAAPGACYMEVNPGPGRALGPQPPAFLDQSPHALLPQTTSVPRSTPRAPASQATLPSYEALHPHPPSNITEKKKSRTELVVLAPDEGTSSTPPPQPVALEGNTGLVVETVARGDDGAESRGLQRPQTVGGRADESLPEYTIP